MGNDVSIWLIVAIGFFATEPWRWAGVLFSKDISEEGDIIIWVRAVSTALIAALVMRLLIAPPGSLENTPMSIRFFALLIATLTYLMWQRRLIPSIFVGLLSFLALNYLDGLMN